MAQASRGPGAAHLPRWRRGVQVGFLLLALARRFLGRNLNLPWQAPRRLDLALRWLKVGVLLWVVWTSASALCARA